MIEETTLITPALNLTDRPSRPPDYTAENAALMGLVRDLANSPKTILQKLVSTIVEQCGAHSGGVSLLDECGNRFYWPAVAGRWANYVGGGTPRDFGPCGTVLDRNMPLLMSHPQVMFPYLRDVTPQLEELLLFPFYVAGKAKGTIWAVSHDSSKQFDSEDARLLKNLTDFTTAAYQAFLAVDLAEIAHHANQRLASIVSNSADAIVTKTLDGTITSWNSGAQRIFGYTEEEAIGKNIGMLIPADREDEEQNIVSKIRAGERINHYETVRRRKDGSQAHVSLSVSPLINAANEIVGASSIARDITERKETERTRELLLNEMKHRVKNNLATIHSVATQTFRGAPKEQREAFSSRIHALAASHDLLSDQHWERATIDEIIARAISPFTDRGSARFRANGPRLWIGASDALMLGMAIHELATNAVKYGALSNEKGHVELSWDTAADAPDQVQILWKECDGPAVSPPDDVGFGSTLLRGAFGTGKLGLDYEPTGVVCNFCIPLG